MSRTVCATAFLAALAAPLTANAQAINYGTLDAQQPNAVHAEVGAEHAFVMSAGYSRTLELGDRPLWVAGYSNDVFGYVPSLRVLQEGGYEGGGAMRYTPLPGPFAPSVEDRVAKTVHKLTQEVRSPQGK